MLSVCTGKIMRLNKVGKYRNKKTVVDGVKFDSKLELYCYELLKQNNIHFSFQYKVELVPKFKYNQENIRAITMVVDFVIYIDNSEIYVDTKGLATETSKIKYKMLKNHLKERVDTDVVWLKNKSEVNSFINQIIRER